MSSSLVKIRTGNAPGWEETSGTVLADAELSSMDVDIEEVASQEEDQTSSADLQSVLQSRILLQSLRQSRATWTKNPPFSRLLSRHPSSSKSNTGPLHPPHTLSLLGACDLEVGPHAFHDTRVVEVTYKPRDQPLANSNDTEKDVERSSSKSPSLIETATGFDIAIEFKENPSDRFILPLDCAIIERITTARGPPTVLLSTVVPASNPPRTKSDIADDEDAEMDAEDEEDEDGVDKIAQRHPITIRFVHCNLVIWDALQRRAIASPVPIQEVLGTLQQAIENPVERAYVPLRLPQGDYHKEVMQVSAERLSPRLLVLRELGHGPPKDIAAIAKRRAALAKARAVLQEKLAKERAARPAKPPKPVRPRPEVLDNARIMELAKEDVERLPKKLKMTCESCKKQLIRKRPDVLKPGFKPICRPCSYEVRRKEETARSIVTQPRPYAPQMKPEVVLTPRYSYATWNPVHYYYSTPHPGAYRTLDDKTSQPQYAGSSTTSNPTATGTQQAGTYSHYSYPPPQYMPPQPGSYYSAAPTSQTYPVASHPARPPTAAPTGTVQSSGQENASQSIAHPQEVAALAEQSNQTNAGQPAAYAEPQPSTLPPEVSGQNTD